MTASARCHHHPAVPAEGNCDSCQLPLCSACSEFTLKKQLCHACAEKDRTRTALRRAAGGLLALGALAGAGAYAYRAYLDHPVNKYGELVEHITGLQDRLAEAPCDYEIAASLAQSLVSVGAHDEVLELSEDFDAQCEDNPDLWWYAARALGHLERVEDSIAMDQRIKAHPLGAIAPNVGAYLEARAVYDQTPCLHRAALKFANKLFEMNAHAAVTALSEEFDAACEPYPRLWWKAHFAHTEQGQWPEAEEIASRLIQYDPPNRDYWLWRGEPRAKQGNFQAAAMDFRQSIALINMSTTSGTAVKNLAEVSTAIGRPCDGAMAIRTISEAGGRLRWGAESLQAQLLRAGDCDRLQGKGSVSVEAPFRTRGAVNGNAVSVLVSPRSALVSVRASRAADLGLAAEGDRVEVLVDEALAQGQIAQAEAVSLGGAQAASVDVLVTETIPDGVDVVIGADFLRRFHVTGSSEHISLRARLSD